MKSLYSILILFISFSANAESPSRFKHWIISDGDRDGGKTLIVIEEDILLRSDASRLSQRIHFKKRYLPSEMKAFNIQLEKFEAKKSDKIIGQPFPLKGTPLWNAVKDEWSETDEAEYSQWIHTHANGSFLKGSGIIVDCADNGLLYRWIYAREHSLPIANSLAGSGKLFGHFTSSEKWDALPTDPDWRKDEKFKAALRELFNQTYTGSINSDQYPVKISPQFVGPGTMYMTIEPDSGHTQTLISIVNNAGIKTIWGNLPAEDETRITGILIDEIPKLGKGGFQKWRTPRKLVTNGRESWALRPAVEMNGYSLEQYETGIQKEVEWVDWIYDHLGIVLSDEDMLYPKFFIIETGVEFRVDLIEKGILYCNPKNPCKFDSHDYDTYSTFTRDARLLKNRNQFIDIMNRLGPLNRKVMYFKSAIDGRGNISNTLNISYSDVFFKIGVMEGWVSDPNVSIHERWGLPPVH